MKKETPASATEAELYMTRRDRIKYTMEFDDIEFPGVKFDKQGNIKKRSNIEIEPFNSEVIFSSEAFLKYIIIRLRKYLEERLTGTKGDYICFGNEHMENRWIVTGQFCEDMGIDFNFIQLLLEHLDYPTCEGDFVNDFTLDEVLERVRNYQKRGKPEGK